jgi:hypothetical protein
MVFVGEAFSLESRGWKAAPTGLQKSGFIRRPILALRFIARLDLGPRTKPPVFRQSLSGYENRNAF